MTASDQEAIEAVLNGYYDAFGRDSAVSASFFGEPALVVFPNQIVRLESRADVESSYEKFVANLADDACFGLGGGLIVVIVLCGGAPTEERN